MITIGVLFPMVLRRPISNCPLKYPWYRRGPTAIRLSNALQVRSVARFLDTDKSGMVDIRELEKAIREFRELSRDLPSLGSGPMTVMDPSELHRFAKRSFLELVQASGSRDSEKNGGPKDEKVVSVSDISNAFEEAFRQRQSRVAMRHHASRQLSAETKRTQVCVCV